MKPFVVSPNAADDLEDMWLYLAEKAGEEIAERTIEKIVQGFAKLAGDPGIGHLRKDLTPLPLHFFFVEPYMVVYQSDRSPLSIHAVLHGARDVRKILRKRPL